MTPSPTNGAPAAAITDLRRRVNEWAERVRVKPTRIRIQRMTRKWGSCSTAGTITLAADLIDQDPAFQDFVIVHELLHLKVPNHGRLFKALLTLHVPGWQALATARCGGRTVSAAVTFQPSDYH